MKRLKYIKELYGSLRRYNNGFGQQKHLILIVITDNSGIDKANLPHLFERFIGKNSGSQGIIGLALARMIIAAKMGPLRRKE